jgi:hypothetical protein
VPDTLKIAPFLEIALEMRAHDCAEPLCAWSTVDNTFRKGAILICNIGKRCIGEEGIGIVGGLEEGPAEFRARNRYPLRIVFSLGDPISAFQCKTEVCTLRKRRSSAQAEEIFEFWEYLDRRRRRYGDRFAGMGYPQVLRGKEILS